MTATIRIASVAFLALGLSACGPWWTCGDGDFCAGGVPVHGLPAELQTPENAARLAREIDSSLAYWGGERSALDGWRLLFSEDSRSGAAACHVDYNAAGCCDYGERTITVWLVVRSCIEGTVLPHEVGHVVIGDDGHADDRWRLANDTVWTQVLASALGCERFERYY